MSGTISSAMVPSPAPLTLSSKEYSWRRFAGMMMVLG